MLKTDKLIHLIEKANIMDKSISILLSYQPFMACLVQRCKLRWTDKVPTAGVRIMPAGVIELLVNPEFFYLQSEAARVGLMWHEMYHLIAGHIEGSYGLDPHQANVAMDESINQLIPQRFLPKRAILPEYFRHEKNKGFEFYYNLHRKSGQDMSKFQQKKEYEGGVDDEQNKKDLKEEIKKTLEEQKQLQDQQEQLQDKQEEQQSKGQKSSDKQDENGQQSSDKQKGLSKNQDKIEDKQEALSEQMQDNGLAEAAETSDDLTDRQKDLRKRMEKSNEDMKKNPSSDPQVQDQQKEQKDLQDKQSAAQKQLEEALNKLEEINKKQQQRKEQKQQGQGQGQGQGGGEPGEPGEGQGKGQGQGNGLGKGQGDEDSPEVMDNHDMWHTSPASPEEQKMSLSNVLSQAVADAERQFGYNSVPTELRQMMEKTMAKPKIKWSTIVKNYFGRCLVNDQIYSRKKPSRKFGYLAPGKSQKFGPKIIAAVDWSGSCSDAEYLEFMTEFKGIAGELAEKIEVIFFDTKLYDQKFMLDDNLKKLPARGLSGGTDFQCVIDYATERKPDLLIYLTDGAAPTPTKPKFPVMWVITGGRDNPALFGKRVLLELDNNKQNTKVLGE